MRSVGLGKWLAQVSSFQEGSLRTGAARVGGRHRRGWGGAPTAAEIADVDIPMFPEGEEGPIGMDDVMVPEAAQGSPVLSGSVGAVDELFEHV